MVRLFNAICLLGLAATAAAGQYTQYDQETQMRDAKCGNDCFFQFFTNKCNADNPACGCTLHDMRQNYFCCLAKNCAPHVLPDSIERSSANCIAYKLPFGPFDAEAICGIKLPASTTSVPPAPKSTSSPGSTPAASSSDSTPSASSSSSAVGSSTAAPASTMATSSNAPASATTGGSSVNATTSAGAAGTTVPVKAGGSRTTLQSVPVVLGLGALVAALM
ncbi:uncharacterized protein BP5553_02631 [Venustampulla echinocandica]|uniref:Extracellular membrane protein CFEM domain-containing protein n=1 Tax=Venustampulla echinocandica TaxID=2656787 RepID=A0A370TS03_9HELO|nr:uncharacterized protein BP5553_02631 [Venustampulla echinocandica]RDL38291.1 hypothetical protein BP5553_02631 [Venustampulla echinocandica]